MTLDDYIKDQGYTFKKFAEHLGVDRVTLWRYRKDPSTMTLKHIEQALILLNISFTELTQLEGIK